MRSLVIKDFPALSYARAEAINTLCINLTFSGENVKKIMVTSSHASEGKSSLSMSVMRAMANMGKRVALVDADLRRSVIATDFGVRTTDGKRPIGLAHYLAGKAEETDVVYKTDIEGAYMVPIGRTLSNPLPLLSSERFTELLDHLADGVDYVIVDAPPVGTVIDGAQIAKSCDGTLLAVRYNTVRRQELIETRDQLLQTGCPILGTVLTMVEYDDLASRKYYYRYYYSKYGGYYQYASSDGDDSSSRKSRRSRGRKRAASSAETTSGEGTADRT